MEERSLLKPDTKFIREVRESGGESLKNCFQCGTCTVICPLSPADNPFPRKEMIWAQWGLKDRLLKDPDLWLCYRCTDCSTYCPRGAKPGDVLAALRSKTISHYAVPHFLAKAFSSVKYLPFLLAVPALLLFLFLWILGDLNFPEGEINFINFIPATHADIGMGAIAAFLLAVVTLSGRRFWKDIKYSDVSPKPNHKSSKGFLKSFATSLIDILKHSDFTKCGTSKLGYWAHLGIFYGSVLLLVATSLAELYHLLGVESPYSLLSPVKWAGHIGGALLLAGCIIAIYRRLSGHSNEQTTYFDWFLLWMLLIVVLSGVSTEVLRLAGLAAPAYWSYLFHLWTMFMLFIYAPFNKGAHLLYRTLALTYSKQIGREASA